MECREAPGAHYASLRFARRCGRHLDGPEAKINVVVLAFRLDEDAPWPQSHATPSADSAVKELSFVKIVVVSVLRRVVVMFS